MRSIHDKTKSVLLGALILALVTANAFTLKLYLESLNRDDSQIETDTEDEISRAKYFVCDWYEELFIGYGGIKVFYNELQFEDGKYTLTVAGDRIRAVYPRGERFFKLEYIRYLEFYTDNGRLLCRLYYGDKGEFVFKVN